MIVRIVRYRSRDSCILREKDSQDSQVQVQGLCVKMIVRIVRYRSRDSRILHPAVERIVRIVMYRYRDSCILY